MGRSTRNRLSWHALSTWRDEHPGLALGLLFGVVWLAAAYVFYLRFPNALTYANFYAEDGNQFATLVMDVGFLRAAFTTFNGYFITGVYVLVQIGMIVNALLFGGQFVNLPEAFALVSYGALGLCAALPIVLLRKYLTWPFRAAIALLIALLPMPSLDYTTIGAIGNLKFVFVYVAFLLVLYRVKLARTSRKIPVVDAVLLLSVYTTAGAYFALPFALFGDGVKPKQLWDKKQRKKTFRRDNIALWSFVVMGTLAFIQIAYVAIKGVPEFPGYLDEPFQIAKAIEVFIARSYLYPAVAAGYVRLNDVIVVLLFGGLLAAVWRWGKKQNRKVYAYGLLLIFATSAVFIANRTGVTAGYDSYTTTRFDNFFFTQNFLFCVIGVMLLADISKRFVWFRKWHLGAVAVAVVALGMVYANTRRPVNDFMQYNVGPLKQQAHEACQDKSQETLTLEIYPFENIHIKQPRDVVCTPVTTEYDEEFEDFGLEYSTDSTAVDIAFGNPAIEQTFEAQENTITGLAVYMGTYSRTIVEGYTFRLMDANCERELRKMPLPKFAMDNNYLTIMFDELTDTEGKTYCFSITPDDERSTQQLAVILSAEEEYNEGALTIGDTLQSRDVLFQVIY